jgi:hypothetical protein
MLIQLTRHRGESDERFYKDDPSELWVDPTRIEAVSHQTHRHIGRRSVVYNYTLVVLHSGQTFRVHEPVEEISHLAIGAHELSCGRKDLGYESA